MNKRINKLLFPVMLWVIPLATITWVYGWSTHALAEKIYADTTKPFLAQTGGKYTHKATIISKSQIEYTVLKAPTVKPTAAKK